GGNAVFDLVEDAMLADGDADAVRMRIGRLAIGLVGGGIFTGATVTGARSAAIAGGRRAGGGVAVARAEPPHHLSNDILDECLVHGRLPLFRLTVPLAGRFFGSLARNTPRKW